AAAAVRELDRLADAQPFPIRQEPERMRAVRAAYADSYRKTMPEAFDRVGRADAPWAGQAREALALKAGELAAQGASGLNGSARDRGGAAWASAGAAGCAAPLVLYSHHRPRQWSRQFGDGQSVREFRKFIGPLWESRYPDLRKLNAVHNYLVVLPDGGRPDP